MQRQLMAPNGPTFSRIVMGFWRLHTWQKSPAALVNFLEQCLDIGVTTMDHAYLYGNHGDPSCEALFGEALKLQPGLRQRMEIVTKCGINLIPPSDTGPRVNHYDASAQAIEASVESSLQRLGIEQLDVLLIHRPDYLLDADEVAQTFTRLHTSGKVAHFGVSNFSVSQFECLQSRLAAPLVTNQVEISPLNTAILDSGVLDQCQQWRVSPMAWSCLGGGRLFDMANDVAQRTLPVLQQVAEETGAQSVDEVLYAWVLALPCRATPIVGSGKIERVQSAVNALNISLTREQWARIWVAAKGHGLP
ncbi:MAG TPA: aldo/keto reductase [Pseudomonadales bacterium]|nr:aldo/keto reductase [Pseudomonadales bacterium]